jgi:hypothetical protein
MKTVDVANELDMHRALRDAIENGAGAAILAREAGCSVQFVYAVYDGQKKITDGIAAALGFERVSGWARKGRSNGLVYDASLRPKKGRRPKRGRSPKEAVRSSNAVECVPSAAELEDPSKSERNSSNFELSMGPSC